jgi:uroporphyrinogen-III synthase
VRLLVTRPDPDGERTACALRALGHDVLTAPLLRIEPIPDADLGESPWAGLIMTSANAAQAAAAHRRSAALLRLPVFTVGSRTRDAARAAGFSSVESADGDVAALGRLVVSRVADRRRPLLYLAGEERAGDLAGILAANGLAVHTAVVYRAVAEIQLSPEVRSALAENRIDGVLHFSKRSAEAFLAAVEVAGLLDKAVHIRHFCLSPQVATPLAAAGARAVRVAGQPEQRALLALLNHV